MSGSRTPRRTAGGAPPQHCGYGGLDGGDDTLPISAPGVSGTPMSAPHDAGSFPPMRGGKPPRAPPVDSDRLAGTATLEILLTTLQENDPEGHAIAVTMQSLLRRLSAHDLEPHERVALERAVDVRLQTEGRSVQNDRFEHREALRRDAMTAMINARQTGHHLDFVAALEAIEPRIGSLGPRNTPVI